MHTDSTLSAPTAGGRQVARPAVLDLRHVSLWTILAVAFTALVIQYSFTYGKLVCPPYYDDVAYFENALHRLPFYYRGGILELIADYRRWPPHSPFSTFLAMGAFMTLGVHDWTPYAANGLIIFALLAFLDYLAADATVLKKVALFVLVLSIPVSFEAVYEFRPDLASALCAAMGATLLLWRSLTKASWQYRAAAGAMFGLALLFKPPTSPLTLILFSTALVIATAIDLLLNRPTAPALGWAWVHCALPMVLVPLPHYLLVWRETWGYIYDPIFGATKEVWASHLTRREHLLYYLTGEGGALMLGRQLPLLLTIVSAGLVALLALRRWRPAARLAGLLCVCAVAFAVPAKMDLKQEFFGASFAWMLLFTAVYALVPLLRLRGRWPAAVIVVLLGYALSQARFGPHMYDRGSKSAVARTRVINDLYQALAEEHFKPYARVYITTTGFVNAGVLDYFYRRDTLHALNIGENSYSGDLQDHQRGINLSDYVIASEPDNGEAFGDFLLSGTVQDKTLAMVRNNPDFEQVGSFPTSTAKHYFLFRRVRPFCGWEKPVGLVEASPEDRGGLRFAYWGVGPSTRLSIPDQSLPNLRIVLGASAANAGLRVTILVDGRRVGRWDPPLSRNLGEFTRPFRIEGGGAHEVRLVYSLPNGAAAEGAKVVLFSKLEIIPDDLR